MFPFLLMTCFKLSSPSVLSCLVTWTPCNPLSCVPPHLLHPLFFAIVIHFRIPVGSSCRSAIVHNPRVMSHNNFLFQIPLALIIRLAPNYDLPSSSADPSAGNIIVHHQLEPPLLKLASLFACLCTAYHDKEQRTTLFDTQSPPWKAWYVLQHR